MRGCWSWEDVNSKNGVNLKADKLKLSMMFPQQGKNNCIFPPLLLPLTARSFLPSSSQSFREKISSAHSEPEKLDIFRHFEPWETCLKYKEYKVSHLLVRLDRLGWLYTLDVLQSCQIADQFPNQYMNN